jgi:hypothetical protein
MRSDRSQRLALWWTRSSVIWLLVVGGVFLFHRNLPLTLGTFRATADAVIVSAVALAFLGVGGLVLHQRNPRLGAGLLAGYCVLWLIPLVAALPSVWNARSSICLSGINICVTSEAAAGLMIGFVIAFSLVALWAARASVRASSRTPGFGLSPSEREKG